MTAIDADKFLAYLIFSKHIDGLTCGEVKEAIEMCKINVLESKTEWIPVSEKLPEPYQSILVTAEDFHFANEPVIYSVYKKSFSGDVDFIAWMPLPEPYKGTNKSCSNCNCWLLDKDDENRRCEYCFDMDEWEGTE